MDLQADVPPTHLCRIIDLAELINKVQHGHISQDVVPFAVVVENVLHGEITGIVHHKSQAGCEGDSGREMNRKVTLSTFLAPTQNTNRKSQPQFLFV